MWAVLRLRLPWNRRLPCRKALLEEALARLVMCQRKYTHSAETAVQSASTVATTESVVPLLLPVLECIATQQEQLITLVRYQVSSPPSSPSSSYTNTTFS